MVLTPRSHPHLRCFHGHPRPDLCNGHGMSLLCSRFSGVCTESEHVRADSGEGVCWGESMSANAAIS